MVNCLLLNPQANQSPKTDLKGCQILALRRETFIKKRKIRTFHMTKWNYFCLLLQWMTLKPNRLMKTWREIMALLLSKLMVFISLRKDTKWCDNYTGLSLAVETLFKKMWIKHQVDRIGLCFSPLQFFFFFF